MVYETGIQPLRRHVGRSANVAPDFRSKHSALGCSLRRRRFRTRRQWQSVDESSILARRPRTLPLRGDCLRADRPESASCTTLNPLFALGAIHLCAAPTSSEIPRQRWRGSMGAAKRCSSSSRHHQAPWRIASLELPPNRAPTRHRLFFAGNPTTPQTRANYCSARTILSLNSANYK